MVFCCFQWPDPHHSSVPENKVQSNPHRSAGIYPGNRPTTYYATGGNALSGHPQACTTGGNKSPPSLANSVEQHHGLVAVTVPPGVSPGQTIRVLHPDGSGRQIEAQVPLGISVGSTFYVQAAGSIGAASPLADVPTRTAASCSSHEPVAMAYPVGGYSHDAPVSPSDSPPPAIVPPPFSECLDNPILPGVVQQLHSQSSRINEPEFQHSSLQNLIKVSVPGIAPGDMIHVQVPGEDRLIAAQVPPNCSEFYVHYAAGAFTSDMTSLTPLQSIAYPNFRGSDSNQQYQPTPPALSVPQKHQKLLLVRIPPGISPGSTLHVQIPDEPGRMLSAEVPRGNVTEFHVAYEPRSYSYHSTSVSPAQPSDQNNGSSYHALQAHGFQRQNQYEQPRNVRQTSCNKNGGNAGAEGETNFLLPLVGGLTAGMASAMVFDHFAHNDD